LIEAVQQNDVPPGLPSFRAFDYAWHAVTFIRSRDAVCHGMAA
jgi:hypothetical protein